MRFEWSETLATEGTWAKSKGHSLPFVAFIWNIPHLKALRVNSQPKVFQKYFKGISFFFLYLLLFGLALFLIRIYSMQGWIATARHGVTGKKIPLISLSFICINFTSINTITKRSYPFKLLKTIYLFVLCIRSFHLIFSSHNFIYFLFNFISSHFFWKTLFNWFWFLILSWF